MGSVAGVDPVLRADDQLAVASVLDRSAYRHGERAASANNLSGAAASGTGAATGSST